MTDRKEKTLAIVMRMTMLKEHGRKNNGMDFLFFVSAHFSRNISNYSRFDELLSKITKTMRLYQEDGLMIHEMPCIT